MWVFPVIDWELSVFNIIIILLKIKKKKNIFINVPILEHCDRNAQVCD